MDESDGEQYVEEQKELIGALGQTMTKLIEYMSNNNSLLGRLEAGDTQLSVMCTAQPSTQF